MSSSASPAAPSSDSSSSGSSLSSLSLSTSSPVPSANNPSTPPLASTAPTQSATTDAPTSTSPTTSPTPTTPQSSPAQTTSVAPQTTPSATASTTPTSASTTAPTTTSTTFISQVPTTIPSTDPAGSVVYVTSTFAEVITTAIPSTSGGSNSSSSTGVIVGAVVGGVAGIIILALLLICIRKRVRNDEFDGNFDPDRVVGHNGSGGGTLPHVDLADEVTPFPQPQSFTDEGSSSMRQYGKSPYIGVPSSLAASGHASTEFYPPGAMDAGSSAQHRPFMQPGAGQPPLGAYLPNMYGTGPVDWHTPRPGASPPPSTVSNTTSSTRAAKEREAMGRAGQGTGLGLATQQEAAEDNGDVVVHQDAGRAPIEEHAPPREIPPAYESIRD